MALTLDSPSNNEFKHFCKICKKGFMCGRALGGHMRAHGIGVEDAADIDDDDDATSDWEAGGNDNNGNSNKRMYALRTNPNRTRSRACENCGKEFLSWKSFLEHGRCGGGSDEEEAVESSPVASSPSSDNGGGWSKKKRTFRSEIESSNFTMTDYNLANCLMMLSNAVVDPTSTIVVDQPEESSASAERNPINYAAAPLTIWAPPPQPKGLFECKACKKVFNSHQALGGHRASHKKVKGCFAARLDRVEPDRVSNFNIVDESSISKKIIKGNKVHECSICHRVFNSGQALGGHKRCHWITPASSSVDQSTLARFQQLQHDHQMDIHNQDERQNQTKLDLNILPGPNNESKNVLSLKVSTEFLLKYEEIKDDIPKNNIVDTTKNDTNDNNSLDSRKMNADDEADSKMKLAKMSELKEINIAGGSSSWLQVGIGSNNGGEL